MAFACWSIAGQPRRKGVSERLLNLTVLFRVLIVTWSVELTLCETIQRRAAVAMCPPSPEGEPVTIHCSGVSKTIDRQVFWDRHKASTNDYNEYDGDDEDGGNEDYGGDENGDNVEDYDGDEVEGNKYSEGDDNYDTVSFCGFFPGSSVCTDYIPLTSGTRMATDRDGPGWFNVSLTLYSPQAADRHDVLFCTFHEDGVMEELTSCRLNLYLTPAEPHCWAEVVKDQDRLSDVPAEDRDEGQALGETTALVRVTCITSRVYPDVRCEMFQRQNQGDEEKIRAPVIKTLSASLEEPQNFQAECHSEFHVDVPGRYEFGVNMFPVPEGGRAAGRESLQPARSKYSKPVDIFFSRLTINLTQSEPVNICPLDTSGRTITFTCTAGWFKTQPQFEWRAAGIKPRTQSVRELGNFTYQGTAEFLPEELALVADISCFVQDADISGRDHVKSVEVKRVSPGEQPSELVFKERTPDGRLSVESAISVKENEDVVLQCVPAPLLKDVETYISCRRLISDETPLEHEPRNDVGGSTADFSNSKDSVAFGESTSDPAHSEITIRGRKLSSKNICTCYAKAKSSGFCFELTRSVAVSVIGLSDVKELHMLTKTLVKENPTQGADYNMRLIEQSGSADNNKNKSISDSKIAVITVGCVMSVVVTMLLSLIIFFYKRRKAKKFWLQHRHEVVSANIEHGRGEQTNIPEVRHPSREEESTVITDHFSPTSRLHRVGMSGGMSGHVSAPLLHGDSHHKEATLRNSNGHTGAPDEIITTGLKKEVTHEAEDESLGYPEEADFNLIGISLLGSVHR
ncbi:uncharacterized protein LOC101860452 [Aplysia californica]|uniref:Uncharacterized protein LOC101860452 n=1 Tax=Aplysia californica TaxID=6500 RepID=A0ABM0K7F3_APLCA|nr:uncharacterized protein LOC101860452 [Aplysia californica]